MKKLNQGGFSAIETVLIIVMLGIIGGTGWYVWHSKQAANTALTNASNAQTAVPQGKPQTLPSKDNMLLLASSQLKVTYPAASWNVAENNSTTDQVCGKEDQAALSFKQNNNFNIRFLLGHCDKDGGSCFGQPSEMCVAESKQLAAVDLGRSQTAYVLAHRTSTDNGKTWIYDLGLVDKATCTEGMCTISIPALTTKIGTITAAFEGEGDIPGNPNSVDEFVKLAPVQAAVAVLKTVHY